MNTIKEQLGSIEHDLEKQEGVYESMLAENKLVNEEVGRKHYELHQRRAEKAHQETKKLKKYDEILRTITREI